MLLKVILENEEKVLSLQEEEWQFLVHFGSRDDTDNQLMICNTLYDMTNSQAILDFFDEIREIPYEDIKNIQIVVNNNIVLFDARSLGFYYRHMFLEFKYNSNMIQIGTQDRGLIYSFIFHRDTTQS